MLRLVMTILLGDTVCFLILGNYLSRSSRVEDIVIHFLRKRHWLLFVLFPWFTILLWLATPVRRLYRTNRWLYSTCQVLVNAVAVILMLIGVFGPYELSSCGLLLCLWACIADILIQHDRGGGGGNQDDSGPDGPTPTGDAVDAWLRLLNRQPTH